jgi:hypothetical protein
MAKLVRLVCEAQDINLATANGFRIDEFQVWSDEATPRNVALASNGGKASGKARVIEDFPDAYGPQLAIDGKTGARFLATGKDLTIELAEATAINRVVFSSAMGEPHPEHRKFVFVADYRIETSADGKDWKEVASGRDRRPARTPESPDGRVHREHRLMKLAITDEERRKRNELSRRLAAAKQELASIPRLPTAWIGSRDAELAKGPFHVFLGGSPQKKGEEVVSRSLAVFDRRLAPPNQVEVVPVDQDTERGANPVAENGDTVDQSSFAYMLAADSTESERRLTLARWITDPANPLTPRVLANRLWHYHFGTGIVSTPNDFGYMGGRPSHPELLDALAIELQENGWRLKPLHRMIMLSKTYRQGSESRADAAAADGDVRLLWRFPPRRLSAEEVRDTVLQVSGCWTRQAISDDSSTAVEVVPDGGPGFRLYQYLQDNVSTYVPLDRHGPETRRRAIYHQNARASVVDLMTDFDQPDCAFSTPRRARTTTPLQALTMLNHQFTLEMADAMADRLESVAMGAKQQIRKAYEICYSRPPLEMEVERCENFVNEFGLSAVCRVLLNTSELIYIE